GGGALQRLTGMGLAYVRFAVANPNLFRLLFRPELRGGMRDGPAAEAMARAGSAAYQVFLDAVTAALEEGSVQGPTEDVALAAWCVRGRYLPVLTSTPVSPCRWAPSTSFSMSSPTISVPAAPAPRWTSAAAKKAGAGLPTTSASVPAACSRPATNAPLSSCRP